MTHPIDLALIYGSNREQRVCDRIAAWAAARVRAHGGYRIETLDPARIALPARMPPVADAATGRLRRSIRSADAFLIVTPEYNHGYPAPLKQLIDAEYEGWQAKPVAFVSYGGFSGGLRAVEQLRQVFSALHAVAVHDSVAFADVWKRFDESGRPRDPVACEQAMHAMLAQLHWWASALRAARRTAPYGRAAAA